MTDGDDDQTQDIRFFGPSENGKFQKTSQEKSKDQGGGKGDVIGDVRKSESSMKAIKIGRSAISP